MIIIELMRYCVTYLNVDCPVDGGDSIQDEQHISNYGFIFDAVNKKKEALFISQFLPKYYVTVQIVANRLDVQPVSFCTTECFMSNVFWRKI